MNEQEGESSCNWTRIDARVGEVEYLWSIAGMFRTRSIDTKPIVDATLMIDTQAGQPSNLLSRY